MKIKPSRLKQIIQEVDGIQTADGRKVQKMMGLLDQPREFVDFLILLKSILKKPEVVEKIRTLANKSGVYDSDDLAAIKRLRDAFEKESEPVSEQMMSNNETIQAMLEEFLPFAQERMGFKNVPDIRLESDEVNAQEPLGKTAYYDPSSSSVTVFVTGRHPKDIMRSISHELVHHTQNGRGEFDKVTSVGEGYAQNDEHLREMEREAYEQGNLCFRDWEDSIKSNLKEGAVDTLKQKWADFKKELDPSEENALEAALGAQIEKEKDYASKKKDIYKTIMDVPKPADKWAEKGEAHSTLVDNYEDMLNYSADCAVRQGKGEPCSGDADVSKWDLDLKNYRKKSALASLEELNMFQKRNKKLNENIMKKFGYKTVTENEEAVTLSASESVTLMDLITKYKAGDEFDALEGLEKNQELMAKVYSVFGHECPGDDIDIAKCLMDKLVETNPMMKEEKEALTPKDIPAKFGVSEDAAIRMGRLVQALRSENTVAIRKILDEEFVIRNALNQYYMATGCPDDDYECFTTLIRSLDEDFFSGVSMAGWTMEEDLKRYVGDKPEEPCKDLEKALVAGEQGGIADCPEARDTLIEPEEEEELEMEPEAELEEVTGFDKDLGGEFDHLFAEEEASPVEDVEEGCAYEDEEDEDKVSVKVNEGRFEKRHDQLLKKLIKKFSK